MRMPRHRGSRIGQHDGIAGLTVEADRGGVSGIDHLQYLELVDAQTLKRLVGPVNRRSRYVVPSISM
jgi:hypothetical protein